MFDARLLSTRAINGFIDIRNFHAETVDVCTPTAECQKYVVPARPGTPDQIAVGILTMLRVQTPES